ncbi:MAG: nucleotidyltransferase domain-containing protein [Burkholderiales bacterium]
MNSDLFLDHACKELVSAHAVHTILLYGSRANGSARPDSDYDIAAFAPVEKTIRDARVVEGMFLDTFIYPESELLNPIEEHLKLRGSKIVLQRETDVENFLHQLEHLFRIGPTALPADEIEARKVWALKMAERMKYGDVEANYRRVWLLTALLEDYFHIRGLWCQGPKKSLIWLKKFDAAVHDAYCAALEPGARHETIHALVKLVIPKQTT